MIPGDVVSITGRPSTAVEVIAVDDPSGTMWVRPVAGGKPYVTTTSPDWQPVVARPTLPAAWLIVSTKDVSKAYPTEAEAQKAVATTAGAVAILSVAADGTVAIDWVDTTAGDVTVVGSAVL